MAADSPETMSRSRFKTGKADLNRADCALVS